MKRILLIAAVAATGLATATATPVHAAGSTGAGYVWANDPTAAFYTPNASYNFNSTDSGDAVNTISRTEDATGPLYTVRFPDLGLVGGTVRVTAYGSGSVACQVQSWAPLGDDQLVWVRCFNNAGTAVNSRFTVAYTNVQSPSDGELAYVWASNATATLHTPYTPNLTYQASSGGGNITITRSATGVYSVHMPGLGNPATTHVQVKVASWTNAGGISVNCFDTDGDAADAWFTLAFTGPYQVIVP